MSGIKRLIEQLQGEIPPTQEPPELRVVRNGRGLFFVDVKSRLSNQWKQTLGPYTSHADAHEAATLLYMNESVEVYSEHSLIQSDAESKIQAGKEEEQKALRSGKLSQLPGGRLIN